MDRISVVYDGWPLIHQPNGPAALHLLALLAHLPPDVHPLIALPAESPIWLTEKAKTRSLRAANTPGDRLRWQQRTLPRLAREEGVHLSHLTHAHPPLLPSVPGAVSPTAWPPPQGGGGFAGRLGAALARGGMARLGALLWPAGLPLPGGDLPVHTLPPIVHPDFYARRSPQPGYLADLALPETFILYHGPYDPLTLRLLLNAWSWAAGAISSLYPLVLLGAGPTARRRLDALLSAYDLADTVRILPVLRPDQIPALYQRCSVLFHPAAVAPWGGAVHQALACGKPIVALESPLADAVVGPAAYLIAGDRSRQMGAALITTIVEEGVAADLSEAARQRAGGWAATDFGTHLRQVYRSILPTH